MKNLLGSCQLNQHTSADHSLYVKKNLNVQAHKTSCYVMYFVSNCFPHATLLHLILKLPHLSHPTLIPDYRRQSY